MTYWIAVARCSPWSSSCTPPKPALDLTDARDHAHRVEDVGRRLVGVVALRDGEDQPVALERGLDGAQGAGPAGGDWGREAREDDRPPKRENGKRLTLTHDGSWKSEVWPAGLDITYHAVPEAKTGGKGTLHSMPGTTLRQSLTLLTAIMT